MTLERYIRIIAGTFVLASQTFLAHRPASVTYPLCLRLLSACRQAKNALPCGNHAGFFFTLESNSSQ